MSIIKIDGKDYETDTLSEDARAQITNLQVVDRRLADLREQTAITQTARLGYANALKAALEAGEATIATDTVEVSSQ